MMTKKEARDIRYFHRTDEIRNLCIRKQYFTNGTNEQYRKMFRMAENEDFTANDVATAIWLCSDSDADLSGIKQEIESIYQDAEDEVDRIAEQQYLKEYHGMEFDYFL